jgi:sugar/nucleoside kinase (ribokinase family)
MIALADWCNLPFATDIWKGILTDILPYLDKSVERQYFFDLADPSKKSVKEIADILTVIGGYSQYGLVTLGLNENEAYLLAEALLSLEGKSLSQDVNLEEICLYVFKKLKISHLLVHPLDASVIVDSKGVRRIPGWLVKKPVISTGGGDNLNAGYCFARMAGCNADLSAVLGMATSGAYVEDGQSPHPERLEAYLRRWKAELR